MNLISWEPFADFDEAFNRFGRRFGRWPRLIPGAEGESMEWAPASDITESDKEYLVTAELPGVKREDVKITLDGEVLTVRGERKQELEKKDEKAHRIERFYGTFSRSFSLPADADREHVRAESKDGLLYVHIPKREAQKPKSVEVKVD